MDRAHFKFRRLTRKELPCDTLQLARFLIGKIVVRDLPEGRLSGRIVEAEGYPPGDPAGHHFRGPTPRNRSLFLRHGHVYVYFNYGMHFMLNISSEPAGVGGGVLIRALEPLEGIEIMQRHRKGAELRDLTRGPGAWPKPCGLSVVLMVSIYFRGGRFGLVSWCVPKPNATTFQQTCLLQLQCASASLARPTSCFVSTNAAVPSSAAPSGCFFLIRADKNDAMIAPKSCIRDI